MDKLQIATNLFLIHAITMMVDKTVKGKDIAENDIKQHDDMAHRLASDYTMMTLGALVDKGDIKGAGDFVDALLKSIAGEPKA